MKPNWANKKGATPVGWIGPVTCTDLKLKRIRKQQL
jgi:hypothetical protein